MADFDDIIGSAEEILARTEALGKYEATQQRILERLGLIANAQSRILELEQERDSAREAFQQREKNLKDLVQERMELEREFRRAQREGDRVVIDARTCFESTKKCKRSCEKVQGTRQSKDSRR
jgi:hypothetical protein